MKLHVGSGSVYLREYVNVDLPLPSVFLAKERPDLVDRFSTMEEDYYGRHTDKTKGTFRKGPLSQETVCDVYGSFDFLPVRPNSVSEILARQCFEHLDRNEAPRALAQSYAALKKGGVLRLDIPDADETLRQYRETGDEFFIRHLFGPRRDMYGFHTHYTRTMLIKLVEDAGFGYELEERNIHCYPAFCLRFVRNT